MNIRLQRPIPITASPREIFRVLPCKECTTCYWYWQNNDTENECKGNRNPCNEYKSSGAM